MFEQGDEGRLHVGRLAPKAPIKQNEGRKLIFMLNAVIPRKFDESKY